MTLFSGGIAGGPAWGNQGFNDDRWGQNRQPQRQFGGPPPPGFGLDFRGAPPPRGPPPPFGHPPPFGRPPPPGPPLPGSPPPGNNFGLQELIGRVGNMAADIAGGGGGEDVVRSFRTWSHGPPPPEHVWRRRARRFCRRFPGHPKCSGGRTPLFEEIATIVTTVVREGGKFLPRVPKIFIKDPLAGINPELVDAARAFVHQLGAIHPEISNRIRDVCRNFKCMEQNQQELSVKETVVKKVFDFEKSVTGKDNTDSINFRLDRTMQVKQALLERANLSSTVTAADNGIFDKDILLTEKQANFLLNELGKAGEGTDVPPPGAKFKRYVRLVVTRSNPLNFLALNYAVLCTKHSSFI
ncbi:hypothetical protein OSTOST_01098 [Ostertagia ostertagi]